MILHLCHHWFWITALCVFVIISVIAQDVDKLVNTNTSHLTPVRSKLKAVLFNATRLYPVPAIVPDETLSSTPESNVNASPEGALSSAPEGSFSSNPEETFSSELGRSSSPAFEETFSSTPGLDGTSEESLTPHGFGLLSSEVEIVVPEGLPVLDKQTDSEKMSNTKEESEPVSKLGGNSASDEQSSRVDTALFASESVKSKELPSSGDTVNQSGDTVHQSRDFSNESSAHSHIEKVSTPISISQPSTPADESAAPGNTELLTDVDPAVISTNQSERLEREIVDIHLHPSFDPGTDGLEHDKLRTQSQEFTRGISTTETPVNDTSTPEAKSGDEKQYTVFVTPASPYSPSHNLTTSPPTAQPIDIVKKSENLSKIKDKVDFKSKFSSKIKEKTTVLKLVTETSGSSTVSSSSESVEDVVSVQTRTNVSRHKDYEVLNNSPERAVSQENATELAIENTSMSADYEDVANLTSASRNNTTTISRTGGNGRALDSEGQVLDSDGRALDTHERIVDSSSNHARSLDDQVSQPRAEDLQNSSPWGSEDINVALISGVSFGAVAIVTLFGAISFIMYRRYRWNKPQTLSDKCSNPDSSGYIDDSTLRENSEEMYSLDNDSFLNSLEAMTIQNYWTDHVKHTKL